MAKTIQDAAIKSRGDRAKLVDEGPHWREVTTGVHLGYRRKKRGGVWVARWYLGEGKYRQKPLGAADDDVKADGVRVLTYAQAEALAKKVAAEGFEEAKIAERGVIPTVRSAVEAYGVIRDNRTREHKQRLDIVSDFTLRMKRNVLSAPLADVELHKLTVDQLREWLNAMPETLAPTSVHRTAKDLKAALNASGKVDSAMVREGLDIEKAERPPVIMTDEDYQDIEAQLLTDEQIRSVIGAAHKIGPDLHRMVLLLAVTGMRLSQLARMRVADVDVNAETLRVPFSRKGKKAADRENKREHRRVDSAVIEALRPVLDRPRGATLLLLDGQPWQSQSISKPWRKIRELASLPDNITPYALRHSSICRMIMRHVPAMLVAKRHNTSVEIIERHYTVPLSRANPERSEEVFEVAA